MSRETLQRPPDQPKSFVEGSQLRRYVVRGLVALWLPVFLSLAAGALGEVIGESAGLMRGAGLVPVGLPVFALLTVITWRKLPAN